jgi:hypothetical protein
MFYVWALLSRDRYQYDSLILYKQILWTLATAVVWYFSDVKGADVVLMPRKKAWKIFFCFVFVLRYYENRVSATLNGFDTT